MILSNEYGPAEHAKKIFEEAIEGMERSDILDPHHSPLAMFRSRVLLAAKFYITSPKLPDNPSSPNICPADEYSAYIASQVARTADETRAIWDAIEFMRKRGDLDRPAPPKNEREIEEFALAYWSAKPDIFGDGFKNIRDLAVKVVTRFCPPANSGEL